VSSPFDLGAAAAGPTAEDRPRPGAVLVRLADVQAEPVEWLWTNRIAVGKLTLIVGDVGAGKTYLTTDVTARVTRGSAWPDGAASGAAGHVLILTSEDGIADTIRPRLDRQGGDPASVDVFRAVALDDGGESAFNLERDLPALEGAIIATRARVVIADPLSAYLGKKDSYKDAEIRGLLTPLADLAERRRVALLGLLHLTKAQQRRILHRVQASIAFVAQARTVLAVGEDPARPGRRLVAPLKNNLGPFPPVLAFRIGDEGLRWEPGAVEGTADILLAGDDAPTRTDQRERDDAKTFLRDLLHTGAMASREVEADAKANGIAQRTLWRAKAELGIKAERHGRGPWYWMLPHPEPAP